MTMNANSSLATYGQLPESYACESQVDGLYRDVNAAAIRWFEKSGGVVADIMVDKFLTNGLYRIRVDYSGFTLYFPDLGAADEWVERMEAARTSHDSSSCICARPLLVGESTRPCPAHGWLGEGIATSPDSVTAEG